VGHRERSNNDPGRSTVAETQISEQDDAKESRSRAEETMPSYLITYHGGPGMPADPEAAQKMLAAFQAWVGEVGTAMRDPGAPLAAAKTVSADSEVDGQAGAQIGGYTLIEAEDLAEAVSLVRSHPFLSRGGSLQVNEAVSVGA
jgi:hypothetical protein